MRTIRMQIYSMAYLFDNDCQLFLVNLEWAEMDS
jgi:hypothetical protein